MDRTRWKDNEVLDPIEIKESQILDLLVRIMDHPAWGYDDNRPEPPEHLLIMQKLLKWNLMKENGNEAKALERTAMNTKFVILIVAKMGSILSESECYKEKMLFGKVEEAHPDFKVMLEEMRNIIKEFNLVNGSEKEPKVWGHIANLFNKVLITKGIEPIQHIENIIVFPNLAGESIDHARAYAFNVEISLQGASEGATERTAQIVRDQIKEALGFLEANL